MRKAISQRRNTFSFVIQMLSDINSLSLKCLMSGDCLGGLGNDVGGGGGGGSGEAMSMEVWCPYRVGE